MADLSVSHSLSACRAKMLRLDAQTCCALSVSLVLGRNKITPLRKTGSFQCSYVSDCRFARYHILSCRILSDLARDYSLAQWSVKGFSIAGWRLWLTGQDSPICSSSRTSSFGNELFARGNHTCTGSRAIRRGVSVDISLVTSKRAPRMS